jgi:branched-chain amino acid aminotransferase
VDDSLQTLVWLNGQVVAGADAMVSALDHGFTVGDGVFETLKVVDGTPFALDRHLARLHASATGLGLTAPDDAHIRSACDELLDAWATGIGGDVRLRITLTSGAGPMGSGRGTRNPTLVVMVAPLGTGDPTTTVATVPWRRNELGATAGIKTTSYADNVMALASARAVGATEALLANTAGNLCEGTGSNVFVVIDGELLTPPLSSGCLAGVTRTLVLESGCGAVERDVVFEALADASEIFLTSTIRDVQAVTAVDGRPVPGAPGPHTLRAMDAFDQIARRT